MSALWPADIPQPAEPSCPLGAALHATTARHLRDGIVGYDYKIAGVVEEYRVAPTGFDPVRATDAALADLGLPPRPAAGTAQQEWAASVNGTSQLLAPRLCRGTSSTTMPAANSTTGGGSSTHYENAAWSGYVNSGGGNTFQKVSAHWITNSGHYCLGCTSPLDESTWVGMDGVYSTKLIQAGTHNVTGYSSPVLFLNACPGSCQFDTIQSTVPVGVDLSVAVEYSPLTGYTTFQAAIGGSLVMDAYAYLNSSYWSGSTAEFINERPDHSGTYWNLTNYDHTYFSNAKTYLAWTSEVATLSDRPFFAFVMTNDGLDHVPPCSTHLLAYPENASGGSFDSVWCNPR